MVCVWLLPIPCAMGWWNRRSLSYTIVGCANTILSSLPLLLLFSITLTTAPTQCCVHAVSNKLKQHLNHHDNTGDENGPFRHRWWF